MPERCAEFDQNIVNSPRRSRHQVAGSRSDLPGAHDEVGGVVSGKIASTPPSAKNMTAFFGSRDSAPVHLVNHPPLPHRLLRHLAPEGKTRIRRRRCSLKSLHPYHHKPAGTPCAIRAPGATPRLWASFSLCRRPLMNSAIEIFF